MIAANGMLLLAQQEMSLSPPDILSAEYHVYAAIQVRPFDHLLFMEM